MAVDDGTDDDDDDDDEGAGVLLLTKSGKSVELCLDSQMQRI